MSNCYRIVAKIIDVLAIMMMILAQQADARLTGQLPGYHDNNMILPLSLRARGAGILKRGRLVGFSNINVNSLFSRHQQQRQSRQVALSLTRKVFHQGKQSHHHHHHHHHHCNPYRRLRVRRNLLDFFDPLEPVELVWELYVNRYEILDEMVSNISKFTRRHSVQAVFYFVGALGAAEVLARLGVLGGDGSSGKKKKGGLLDALRNSQRVNEGIEERFYQKTSSFMLNSAIDVFSKFRHFNNKSKFAIAVSAGGLFGQVAIQTTVIAVKAMLISFFALETASFLGIIGEPGESIMDWVEDEFERSANWTAAFARWHKEARKCMNLEVLENLYEACVDEEKIASFGFSVGTIFALITT